MSSSLSARAGGYLGAATALLVVTLGLGWLLAAAIGYRLAFLPAAGCLVGGALAGLLTRRPRTVFVSSVAGAAVGILAVPAWLVLVAAVW